MLHRCNRLRQPRKCRRQKRIRSVPSHKGIEIVPDGMVLVFICHNPDGVINLFLIGKPVGFFQIEADISCPYRLGRCCPCETDGLYDVLAVGQDVVCDSPESSGSRWNTVRQFRML